MLEICCCFSGTFPDNLRVPRAIATAFMPTVVTRPGLFGMRRDQVVTHMAVSSDPHAMLLVDQVLPAGPTWALQDNRCRCEIVARYNRGLFFVSLREGIPLFSIGLSIALVSLGRVTSTFLAPDVLAAGTFST